MFFIEENDIRENITDVSLTFSEDTVCPNNTNMYCAKHQFESLEIGDDVEGIGVTFMINFIRTLVSSSNGLNFLQLQLFSKIATNINKEWPNKCRYGQITTFECLMVPIFSAFTANKCIYIYIYIYGEKTLLMSLIPAGIALFLNIT